MEIQSYKRVQRFASNMLSDAEEDRKKILVDAYENGVHLSWDRGRRIHRNEVILSNTFVVQLALGDDSENPVSQVMIDRIERTLMCDARNIVSSSSTCAISNLIKGYEVEVNTQLLSYIKGI